MKFKSWLQFRKKAEQTYGAVQNIKYGLFKFLETNPLDKNTSLMWCFLFDNNDDHSFLRQYILRQTPSYDNSEL